MSEPEVPVWEAVNKDQMTYKLRIPSGWLYQVRTVYGVALAFVPDEREHDQGSR